MNWTYTLLHYPMNMDRSRSIVHVLMYVKLYGLVRNSICTAMHCPCHTVIGREREREEGREREMHGESKYSNFIICSDWFFD